MSRARLGFAALAAPALLALAALHCAAAAAPLEPLVPSVAAHPFGVEPGPRAFENRLWFSPGVGSLGAHRLYVFRLGYNPTPWLGWEGSLGHNPGQSVHAVLHTFSAIVRRPFAGRFQPYLAAGYGMMMVFPGDALNADPVTKNALVWGGGLEFYIRDDLALRGDTRGATVLGRVKDQDGTVAYQYVQYTLGLSFHRTIAP